MSLACVVALVLGAAVLVRRTHDAASQPAETRSDPRGGSRPSPDPTERATPPATIDAPPATVTVLGDWDVGVRVSDSEGHPLEGALVQVLDAARRVALSLRTDAAGLALHHIDPRDTRLRATFGTRPETLGVRIRHPGFEIEEFPVPLGSAVTERRLRSGSAWSVHVVRASDGRGVAGARVVVRGDDAAWVDMADDATRSSEARAWRADEYGRFVTAAVPAGVGVRVTAWAPGLAPAFAASAADAADRTLEITLDDTGPAVAGRVVDASGHARTTGIVYALPAGAASALRRPGDVPLGVPGARDAHPWCTVQGDGGFAIHGLDARQRWRCLYVGDDGVLGVTDPGIAAASPPAATRIVARAPSTLRLHFVSGGENVTPSDVHVEPAPTSDAAAFLREAVVRTDGAGTELSALDAGRYRVSASFADRMGTVAEFDVLPESASERNVDLAHDVRVRVRVIAADGGEPGGSSVVVRARGAMARVVRPLTARLDSSASLTFRCPAEAADALEIGMGPAPERWTPLPSPDAAGDVLVHLGDTPRLRVVVRSAPGLGRDVAVRVVAADEVLATLVGRLDDDDAVECGVPATDASLLVHVERIDDGARASCGPLRIAGGVRPTVVEVTLRAATVASGGLVDGSGAPLANAEVRNVLSGERTRSDASGRWSLPACDVAHVLRVQTDSQAQALLHVEAASDLGTFALSMASLRVRVRGADGRPRRGVLVTIRAGERTASSRGPSCPTLECATDLEGEARFTLPVCDIVAATDGAEPARATPSPGSEATLELVVR